MDEREAIRRCRQGDRNAFGFIVQRYQAQILALCLRMTGSREDAADLAQQAFVQAYRHLAGYDSDHPFSPWLYRIATNECIAHLRRRRHQTVGDEETLAQVEDLAAEVPALVELAQDRESVRTAVAALPLPYRTVVVLYYFQGLNYQEIAQQTGLPIGTISTQLYRAKQLLKRQLAEQEVTGGDASATRTASGLSG
ncbi:MAG: RNA polymerase sigma factor [Mycobacterium leprae]